MVISKRVIILVTVVCTIVAQNAVALECGPKEVTLNDLKTRQEFAQDALKNNMRVDSRGLPGLSPDDWKKVSIKVLTLDKQKPLIFLVEKILSLNKQLDSIGDKKTSESKKIEDEISNINNQIDEMVYKLYGITEEEKKVIEESLK